MTCFHPESDECISSCENLLEWKSLWPFVVHEFLLNLFRKIIPENFVHEFSNFWIAFSRSFLCNIIIQIMHLLVEKSVQLFHESIQTYLFFQGLEDTL